MDGYSVPERNKPLHEGTDEGFDVRFNPIIPTTPKERFKANAAAIKLLNTIGHRNNMSLSDKEADTLKKYTGFGGLADAFVESNSDWKNEYLELKSLLTEKQYENVRRSILDSYYTNPKIIKNMYKALEQPDFSRGNILEPSCGVGKFFSYMPPEILKNSSVFGVEIDEISGQITKMLYPTANIQVKGFQETDFNDNSFDVVVGNVPFGDIKFLTENIKSTT